MYKHIINTGEVIRIADSVVVAPCQSILEQNYIDYINWVNVGNSPIEEYITLVLPKIISVLDFRTRFTDAELIGLLTLANSGDSNAQLLLLKVQTANEGIDLNSISVQNGLNYLVLKQVITQTRKTIIEV